MKALTYQKNFFKIADFVSWQQDKTLYLSPKFQRRAVWKKGTKSYLIDTIVKGLPIPIIFLRDRPINIETFRPEREVIDGQQRIRTVLSFIDPSSLPDYNAQTDEFTVQKVHNPDLANKKFKQLEPEIKQAILNYEFSVHILPSRVDDRDVVEIFHRMNSTYYDLNAQELRNSQYFGEFKTLAYDLAATYYHDWKKWSIFNDDDIARMKEVELTSELLIFLIEKEIRGRDKKNLDAFYERYDQDFPEKAEIRSSFEHVMRVIDEDFKNFLPSSYFKNQTIIYVFWIVIHECIQKSIAYDLEIFERLSQQFKQKSEDLPSDIQKVLNSRRQNRSDRDTFFKYIHKILLD